MSTQREDFSKYFLVLLAVAVLGWVGVVELYGHGHVVHAQAMAIPTSAVTFLCLVFLVGLVHGGEE